VEHAIIIGGLSSSIIDEIPYFASIIGNFKVSFLQLFIIAFSPFHLNKIELKIII
jgi:hypothetical protein